MTRQYHDSSEMFIDENNKMYKGLAYPYNFYDMNEYEEYIILPTEEYRPDKIANKLWDAPDLTWILDILNDFTNGISEYRSGITIRYISQTTLTNLGIL